MKTANIEEKNLRNLRNFNEIFSKNVTFDNINRQKKCRISPSLHKICFLKPPSHFRVNQICKYTDTGLPCWAALFYLKYFVAFPPLMMQDSLSFNIVLIQAIKSSPNCNF